MRKKMMNKDVPNERVMMHLIKDYRRINNTIDKATAHFRAVERENERLTSRCAYLCAMQEDLQKKMKKYKERCKYLQRILSLNNISYDFKEIEP